MVRKIFHDPVKQEQMIGMNAEVGPLSTAFALKQSGFTDDLHVTGNGGLRHSQNVGELANAEGAIHHESHNTPTGIIAKGAKKRWCGFFRHEENHNENFRYVKPSLEC
jgi:hypothetical protein